MVAAATAITAAASTARRPGPLAIQTIATSLSKTAGPGLILRWWGAAGYQRVSY
jgi:hypothetical protein